MLKINIIRGEKDSEKVVQKIQFQEARKTLDGDFMIFDHDLIDIVVSKEKLKVSTFPKETLSEEVTLIQEKILKTLARSGVVDRSSIRGGSVHSCLEATILESSEEEISSLQMALLEIYNFLQEEEYPRSMLNPERRNVEGEKEIKRSMSRPELRSRRISEG